MEARNFIKTFTPAQVLSCGKMLSKFENVAGAFKIWRFSGIFTVSFEHISHLVLVLLLLTMKM